MSDRPLVTGIHSVTVVVTDQDRALAFYRDVLGCEVRVDTEIWPGARLVEVVPAGSVPDSEVLHLEGAPPMFTVADPDGNTVVLMADR